MPDFRARLVHPWKILGLIFNAYLVPDNDSLNQIDLIFNGERQDDVSYNN